MAVNSVAFQFNGPFNVNEVRLKTLFNIVEDRFKKNLNFDVCVV